ncbi:hypothetical protein HPP92_007926 [Vanilla planifolia]|uniref:Uncharacterized protein n=1 Tax=Vanilla planifolia TaxID=51239 RepID=A0A835VB57_VANPL|nr:hypothetical protein HPP92_007926 [Vanilla planifolia]
MQLFTYKQLQLATGGFGKANIVGHGSFGSVYRGFFLTVELLTRLRSPYLLGLIGYCSGLSQAVFVYDFMANGGLHEHLYPTSGTCGGISKLDWETRMRIAFEAARGLNTSRSMSACPNFHAKVSDFGLAKLGPEKIGGHVSTRVLGTQGYVAPDYGVVLLELLTGRVPVDMKRPTGEGVLVSWALPRLTDREKVVQIMDPALEGQYSMKDAVQVAAIAAMCVQPEADYRPLMADVVQSLVPLVKQKPIARHVGSSSGGQTPKLPGTPGPTE